MDLIRIDGKLYDVVQRLDEHTLIVRTLFKFDDHLVII